MYEVGDIVKPRAGSIVMAEIVGVDHRFDYYDLKIIQSHDNNVGHIYDRSFNYVHENYDKVEAFKAKINKLNL
jgi:hypothetical protein